MTDNLKRAEECGAVNACRLNGKIYGITFTGDDLDLYTAKVIEEVMKWQPIETAPKDGMDFLVIDMKGITPKASVCHYHNGRFLGMDRETRIAIEDCGVDPCGIGFYPYPTHWMPLPNPPAMKEGGE